MRFLLDESADLPLADLLTRLGHDVKSIAVNFAASISDKEVLSIALEENRILITNDHDFGDLVFRRSLPHAGVVLFRLGEEGLSVKAEWLREVLKLPEDQLRKFIVVNDRAIRVRERQTDW